MNKEQIFDQAAQAYMAKFSLSDFKMTHPRLFKAIMEAMDNVNQPPKSAGVKEPGDYIFHIPIYGADGNSDPIYQEEDVRKALTAQAKDFEEEEKEFAEWCLNLKPTDRITVHPPTGSGGSAGIYMKTMSHLLTQFRNQKPRV